MHKDRRIAVGVVGVGAVGRTQVAAFRTPAATVLVNDPRLPESVAPGELARRCAAVFVSVPTPSRGPAGPVCTDVLDAVVAELAPACEGSGALLAIRSTVPPDALQRYRQRHPGARLVANPEFLVERDAMRTALAPALLVAGAERDDDARALVDLYASHSLVRPARVVRCGLTTASRSTATTRPAGLCWARWGRSWARCPCAWCRFVWKA